MPETTMQYLERCGRKIGERAQNIDDPTTASKAKEVMRWYYMHHAAPGDPGARMFLDKAVEDYKKEHPDG